MGRSGGMMGSPSLTVIDGGRASAVDPAASESLGMASGVEPPPSSQNSLAAPPVQPKGNKMATERELVDAKLEAAEARTETRFVELTGKIDRLSDMVTNLATQVGNVRSDMREEIIEIKADSKFTRVSIILAVVAAVLAGLAALYASQANLLAAFQAGLAGKQEIRSSVPPTSETK